MTLIKPQPIDINRLALAIQLGQHGHFNWLTLLLDPMVAQIIGRIGAHPGKPAFPLSFEELVQEAYWILWFQIIPRYKPSRGDFRPYAYVYLNRELRKRVQRLKHKLRRNVPLEGNEFVIEKSRSQTYPYPLWGLLILWREWPMDERRLIRILVRSQEPLSVRRLAQLMRKPVTTVWRIRQSLIARIKAGL